MIHDVLIVGSLCGVDVVMADHLARHGLNPLVVRRSDAGGYAVDIPKGYLEAYDPGQVVCDDNPLRFLRRARDSRLILSMTGALVRHLRGLWFGRHLIGLPPVVNLTTGSDITELAVERSFKGWLYRQYLRFADLNWCYPMPHALQSILALDVPNVVFMSGYPLIVPKRPPPRPARPRPAGAPLRMLHASHFDWNYTDFGPQRNSTKGNDKFLRAFIRAVRQGLPVTCTMLDRGPDRQVAREMLRRGGVEDAVTWKGHLSRDDFHREILEADVVVNMFAHGGIGGVSVEAMCMGKAVMQYANKTYFDMMYGGSVPPVVNCYTEDEILERIGWCCRSGDLDRLGAAGSEWVQRHMAPEKALTTFLFYYAKLTGNLKVDLGPHIRAMEDHVARVQAGTYDPYAGLEPAPEPVATGTSPPAGDAPPFRGLPPLPIQRNSTHGESCR